LAVPKPVITSATAALLPDLDIFLPGHFNPDATLAHRGFTHSLFGVAVLAPLIAIVPWWLSKQKGTYWRLVALVAMGMISHLALDLPTELGLKIFWPFYAKHVYVDWLGGIDLTLFTVALFVLLAAWTYAKPGQALRRGIFSTAFLVVFCWWLFAGWPLIGGRLGSSLQTEEPLRSIYPLVLGAMLLIQLVAIGRANWSFQENRARFGLLGLATFAVYLCACGSAHWAAVERIDDFTQVQGIKVLARTANRFEPSSFLAPARWTGLVLAPEGVYRAEMSPFGSERPKFKFYPNVAENAFVTKARSIPAVQRYLADTRFPVSCYEQQEAKSLVEFYDPWLGVGVVRVTLNQQRGIESVRWIRVREYVSRASFSAPDKSIARNVVPRLQTGPCFLATVQQVN
jgi:membrane-bound metal-dependent hydrolase YbcI (DUF457 family)